MPTRLQRLGAVIDRARPSRSGRNVRKWMETIGMALIVFGFVCILLGWYGAAHSPYLYQEVPYLISGGLLGVALVIGGGMLRALRLEHAPGRGGPAQRAGHRPLRRPARAHSAQPRRDPAGRDECGHEHEETVR